MELKKSAIELLISAARLSDVDAWRLIQVVRSGRFCPKGLPVILLCEDPQEPLLVELAADYGAQLLANTALSHLPTRVAAALAGADTTRPTVLVIEDDEACAGLVEASLAKHYRLEYAYTGEQGLVAWSARQHDLVLLDLMLPDLAGADMLGRMMSIRPGQPVVIVTAHGDNERYGNLMLAGAAEFIDKPIDPDQLRLLCARVLHVSATLAGSTRHAAQIGAQREASHRLSAATRCLQTGRTSLAEQQIRHARAALGNHPLGDDDWVRIFDAD